MRVLKSKKEKKWEQLPWGIRAKGDNLMKGVTTDAVFQKLKQCFNEYALFLGISFNHYLHLAYTRQFF